MCVRKCPNRHEPGTGKIDFESLFKIIDESNYKGWIGAEYKPLHSTKRSLTWLSQTRINKLNNRVKL
jgi:hydroxypyruvate isomerase